VRLWLRRREARELAYDAAVSVASPAEWREAVADPALVSSVLWAEAPLFRPEGTDYLRRSHPHERGYRDDPVVNASYAAACDRLAARLGAELAGARVLAYAPLRGAFPIWRALRQRLPGLGLTPYFPVTSSFVFYPEAFGIRNRTGRPASGRFANRLELARLRPLLAGFDALLYLDEIVSGGMLKGHLRDMLDLGIDREIPIFAAGLADAHGVRSEASRRAVVALAAGGRVRRFLWEGCATLITEDQRFLLGVHYADYALGPHAVPMLDESLAFYPERDAFDAAVMGKDAR
jgi:hypothetical protein